MKKIFALLFAIIFCLPLFSNNITDAWAALEKQDRTTARQLLEKALKDKNTFKEASLMLILLNYIEEKKESLPVMENLFEELDTPSPYLFSLWFDDAVTNGYWKKKKDRLAFLNKIIKSPNVNESIKAGGNYILGMHHLYSNNVEQAWKTWENINAIKNWQFTGPFYNVSGSGFLKEYAPVSNPKPDAKFVSSTNSDIYWFKPAHNQKDNWIATSYFIPEIIGTVYAQTFVTAPEDMEVVLALGRSGDIKLWVNDFLLISEEEEQKTELDIVKRKVQLKKGGNRILIQLGHTSKTGNFANFMVRLLDENLKPIDGLTGSDKYIPYAKNSANDNGEPIEHFAEAYFKNKIKEEPNNILNHILLAKTFYRSDKTNQAIEILLEANKKAPKNIFIHQALLENYNKLGNRTEAVKKIEEIRSLDASLPLIQVYDYTDFIENENYGEAEPLLESIKKWAGENSKVYLNYLIELQSIKKEYQKLLLTVDKAFKLFPDDPTYMEYHYRVTKNISKNPTEASGLLEDYLKTTYDNGIEKLLSEEYKQQGTKNKIEKLLAKQMEMFPEESKFMNAALSYYYSAEDYKKAKTYGERKISNTPFTASAWSDLGYIEEALGNKKEAEEHLKKAIHYNPNLFSAREKIRDLQGKPTFQSLFKRENVYDEINSYLNKESSSDDNYEYIFNERNYIVFPEGPYLEYAQLAIRMLNETGVQTWKETSIGTDNSRQRVITEKAELIKKNGQRVAAEQSGGQIVFPSIEVGDAVYVVYKIENYSYGKLRKEFWNTNYFNDFVPINESKFRLLLPTDYDIDIKKINVDVEPITRSVDDFVLHEWALENIEKCKDESYMPTITEVGKNLHFSTVKNWGVIADWYHDLAMPLAKDDYNVNQVYDEIFKEKKSLSEREKAEAIYDYLCNNIRYSSVSFRQSGYVPQKPMTTLSTQLGDCKDLSLLYHTLAKKAGINTNLVLVNTRDNGEETMVTPSNEFNHCIIKIDLPDETIFQELTSEKLPFGYMPNTVLNAQALVIPNTATDNVGSQLIHVPPIPSAKETLSRTATIKIAENKLNVKTSLAAEGALAAEYRYYFMGLTNERTKEEMESLLSRDFKNHLALKDYNFEELDSRTPTFNYHADFSVENEVLSIGGMNAVPIPFFEAIVHMDAFQEEERKHPFLYWLYETGDEYRTELIFELPEGKEIVELPAPTSIENPFINYSIGVEKISDQKIKINRTAIINRKNISPKKYPAFREAVKKIIEAEDKYIVFK